jgi:hypothetical protein
VPKNGKPIWRTVRVENVGSKRPPPPAAASTGAHAQPAGKKAKTPAK